MRSHPRSALDAFFFLILFFMFLLAFAFYIHIVAGDSLESFKSVPQSADEGPLSFALPHSRLYGELL